MITTIIHNSLLIQNSQLFEQSSHQYVIIMITTVSCDLFLQATCKLVNLSTRQLQIMITDVLTVQSSRVKTQIIKFKAQSSMFKG